MQFQHPEDQEFFAHLLTDGDIERLKKEYSVLFDFRHQGIKRWEFNKTRKKLLEELIKKYNGECQLKIHPECCNDNGFEPDHVIPISSNILNKELRNLKGGNGLKTITQDFGSNDIRNLTLACKKCNARKKNKILDGEILRRILGL